MKPPSTQVEMGASGAVMDRATNGFLWGPAGLGVGFLIVFCSLYQMNYRIE